MIPLTKEAVVRILGPTEDHLIAELLATGCTEEELAQAYVWLTNEEALVKAGQPFPSGRVAELIEIIDPSRDLADEDAVPLAP